MIKIRLEKWEKAVVMQVLEQDNIQLNSGVIFKYNKFELKSTNVPDITFDSVYIRGDDKTCDFDISFKCFKTNAERDVYYNQAIELFKAYNNRNNSVKSDDEKTVFVLE